MKTSPPFVKLPRLGLAGFAVLFVYLALVVFPQGVGARIIISTPYGTHYQVNVDSLGQNIPGDAANEPSLCVDFNNPNRVAVGWRQFNTTNSSFRQGGFGWSTNGGATWTFGGTLDTNVFRSDPVLNTDAEGRFYYLSLRFEPPGTYFCEIWRSTNGGANWQLLGPAAGGDKQWMAIDRTSGPGHDTIYEDWDTASPTGTRDFSLSYDGGLTWANPIAIPDIPIFGTLDIGPNGEVYLLGTDGSSFWMNRSTSATNHSVPFAFDLTVQVDLGGTQPSGVVNPGGLLGQAWIAVDRSTNSTRGNVYTLCSTGNASNQCDVMFARSTDGGTNWSAPIPINDPDTNAFHWFGTLAVAPNGRIDVCWYDTRIDPSNLYSQLYYCFSLDGGLTWSTNRAVSPPFNSTIGWPQQNKIGDYIGMVALTNATCVIYSATYNGEQDVYFLRMPDLPIQVSITKTGANATLSWNAIPGNSYCLQYKSSLSAPWPNGSNEICQVAVSAQMTVNDAILTGSAQRYYRVIETSYNAESPTLVSQPASVTNYVSLPTTFAVNAVSIVPLSYQWKSNGVAIAGATQSTLTLRPLTVASGASYSVTVSNVNGALSSTSAVLTVLSPPTSAPNISNLVLHLPFDGSLIDATGRGNNGTAIQVTVNSSNVTTPTFVSGMIGSAALHYSSDFGVFPCCSTTNANYVTLGVRPDLQFGSNINFSVAYWIRLPANYAGGDLPFFTDTINSTFGPGFLFAPTYGDQGTQTFGNVNGGWALSLFDGTSATNGVADYGDPNTINDGNWHHLVHTIDRVHGVATYLDGVLAHYTPAAGDSGNSPYPPDLDNGHPAMIGQDPTGMYPETGSADIDDLGVWHRALTALEAASIYMAGVTNHLSFTGSP